MFPKIDDPAACNAQVLEICKTYRDTLDLNRTQGIHTVSIDEQPGIQALVRITADLFPQPGMIARREYEYIRHGTLTLSGNLHIATGKTLSPMVRVTRTEEDFLENIDGLVCTDRAAPWRFMTDNFNTHASESLVRYIAAQCGIETDPGKGSHGILQSLQSRRDFWLTRAIRFCLCTRRSIAVGSIKLRSSLERCEESQLAIDLLVHLRPERSNHSIHQLL